MRVIRRLAEVPPISRSVATIGNFDGVHLGHAAIFERVREETQRLGVMSVAMTFEPHPLVEIAPERAPVPLSTLEQRIGLIEAQGIDLVFLQSFDREFSLLSAEEFIRAYLVDALKVKTLCVGANFRFGYQHRGDIDTLRTWRNRFEVVEVPAVVRSGGLISSSRIRNLLHGGEVSAARRLLGHCYEIEGEIVAGRGRGRQVTVPTLNLAPKNRLIPRDGVYLTQVSREDGCWMNSLTNVGFRPTFQERERTIETHVLAREPGSARGRLRVRFLRRLRDEQHFEDASALKTQIGRDIRQACRFFDRLDPAWSEPAKSSQTVC